MLLAHINPESPSQFPGTIQQWKGLRTLQIDGLHADSALEGEHTPAQTGPFVPAGPKHQGKFPGMFHLVV